MKKSTTSLFSFIMFLSANISASDFDVYAGLGLFSDRIKEGFRLSVFYNGFQPFNLGIEYSMRLNMDNNQSGYNQLSLEIASGDRHDLKASFSYSLIETSLVFVRPKVGVGILEDIEIKDNGDSVVQVQPMLSAGILVGNRITENISFTLNTDAVFSSYSYNGGESSSLPTGFESIDMSIGFTAHY